MSFNNTNVIVSGGRSSLAEFANYTTVFPKPTMVDNKIVLTQSMVSKPNVKYIIKWNFDLDGETITVPEGCLIEFDGGSISNGTLVGQDTILIYNQPLNDILTATLEGTWRHESGVKTDEEDITDLNGELKFKDKAYAPANYSGLGRKILRKNIVNGVNTLTQNMINETNTIYIIQYDFTLGEDITVPAGCILDFQGGSISANDNNDAIIGGLFYTKGVKVFDGIDVTLDKGSIINPVDFGAKLDGVTNDTDALNSFFKALYNSKCNCTASGTALINSPVTIGCGCNLPNLNIKVSTSFSGNTVTGIPAAIYIDNYRYENAVPLNVWNETMIQNCTITLGKIFCESYIQISGVLISSAKNIVLNIEKIERFENGLFLNAYDENDGWISYSTFNIQAILQCKNGLKILNSDRWNRSKYGWTTECSFYNTLIKSNELDDNVCFIDINSNNQSYLNGLGFYKMCLEGGGAHGQYWAWVLKATNATNCLFMDCRFERNDINKDTTAIIDLPGSTNFIFFNPSYLTNPDTFIKDNTPNKASVFLCKYGGQTNLYGTLKNPASGISFLEDIDTDNNTDDWDINRQGLTVFQNSIVKTKPDTVSASGGVVTFLLGKKEDYTRSDSLMFFSPAAQKYPLLYVRKCCQTQAEADAIGSNFYKDWYKVLFEYENNIHFSTYGRTKEQCVPKPSEGFLFKDERGKVIIYFNNSWVEPDGVPSGTRRDGRFDQKPSGSDIYPGFMYMIVESTPARHMPIFYGGDNKWYDAAGNEVTA